METKTYFFRPDKKGLKQGFVLTDENKNTIYEAIMTKFALFTAFGFKFVNHAANTFAEHKVGHTLTLEQSGAIGVFATKSSFKFDGKNIWDYLHDQGVRIDSDISRGSLGMTYTVSLKGKEIAAVSMANPGGNNLIVLNRFCYDIKTSEEYLDLAFLCAFAFARTEQAFYD